MQGLDNLLDVIRADYARFSKNHPNMIQRFNDGLRVENGKKYLKVITGNSVWGFIVTTTDDSKFAFGDILKAESWAKPARNQARGNVVTGDLSWVRWTGPAYLI